MNVLAAMTRLWLNFPGPNTSNADAAVWFAARAELHMQSALLGDQIVNVPERWPHEHNSARSCYSRRREVVIYPRVPCSSLYVWRGLSPRCWRAWRSPAKWPKSVSKRSAALGLRSLSVRGYTAVWCISLPDVRFAAKHRVSQRIRVIGRRMAEVRMSRVIVELLWWRANICGFGIEAAGFVFGAHGPVR